jgi:hypothetical protein
MAEPPLDRQGERLSSQPRIRLTRGFDQRSHSLVGYVVCRRGPLAECDQALQAAVVPGWR